MAEQLRRARPPRFNHIAMSMPGGALDESGRNEIVDFYSQVFGWEELPTLTEDRKRLVLQAYRYDQFVFLIADEDPMVAPRMDHFGMAVDSIDAFDELVERVRRWKAERDDRVDLIDKHVDDHGVLKIWSFYVRHLLPMMIEVQFFELSEEARQLTEEQRRRERQARDAEQADGEDDQEKEPAA